MNMERRFTSRSLPITLEQRDDGTQVIAGYGAVFFNDKDSGTEYHIADDFAERISRSAFDSALKRPDDVRGLYNHDPNHLLGRTSAKTMTLSVDDRGLRYEIDVPDTTMGRDVAASIARGDLSGSSFSFIVDRQQWTEEEERLTREIQDVTLYDVGPVTFPAYEATTADVRNFGAVMARESYRKQKRDREASRRARRSSVLLSDIDDVLTGIA